MHIAISANKDDDTYIPYDNNGGGFQYTTSKQSSEK